MKVYYMNGAGNDFMVMDARGQESQDFSALAKRLCALRHADPRYGACRRRHGF